MGFVPNLLEAPAGTSRASPLAVAPMSIYSIIHGDTLYCVGGHRRTVASPPSHIQQKCARD